ncbi:MAG: VCBS repeat-containing protein [Candidatus Hydrogenedens sp.]|nr:VCBS repeat-containing protein [Candidatus Hydrogenedens sp.]
MFRLIPSFFACALILLAAMSLLSGCDSIFEENPVTPASNPIIRAFENRVAISVGESPYEVLSADLNRDGIVDLVTLDWNSETVSVLLGDVEGFKPRVSYPVGPTPRAGVIAPLTSDGYLSIAVLSEELEQITVLFGNGQGQFPESGIIPLTTGSGPIAMTAADFNLDGIADLAVSHTESNTVSIILSQGDKFFYEPAHIPVGKGPVGLCAVDLDRDRIPEIIVANSLDDTLSIISFTERGYEETTVLPCSSRPRRVQYADMNRDGVPDLLVSREFSRNLAIFYGTLQGTFVQDEVTFSGPVSRFVVDDFTSDAIPDIVALLFGDSRENLQPSGTFEVMQGDLSGNFKSAGLYGTGWGSNALLAEDMNRDGYVDLVTGDLSTNSVSLIYNRGNGSFETERHHYMTDEPGEMLLADFIQKGLPDLVISGRKSNLLYLFANQGDGSFIHSRTLSLGAQALALAAGDLNNDGRMDLVVSLHQQYDLLVFMNSGGGQFQPARRVSVLSGDRKVLPQVLSIALGDVDGDGHPDIVTANSKIDSVSVLLNRGDGTFEAAKTTKVDNYPRDIHLVDTNRDQKLDLVFLSRNDPDVATDGADPRVCRWFGLGDGTFHEDSHIRISTGSAPRALRLGDYTGNGSLDCATIHPGDNSLYLLRGGANGNFTAGKRFSMGIAPQDLVFADVRKDGKMDMLCTNDGGSFYLRFSRGGDLGFEGVNNFSVRPGISKILAADLNKDGFPDVVLMDRSRKAFYVLRGRSF